MVTKFRVLLVLALASSFVLSACSIKDETTQEERVSESVLAKRPEGKTKTQRFINKCSDCILGDISEIEDIIDTYLSTYTALTNYPKGSFLYQRIAPTLAFERCAQKALLLGDDRAFKRMLIRQGQIARTARYFYATNRYSDGAFWIQRIINVRGEMDGLEVAGRIFIQDIRTIGVGVRLLEQSARLGNRNARQMLMGLMNPGSVYYQQLTRNSTRDEDYENSKKDLDDFDASDEELDTPKTAEEARQKARAEHLAMIDDGDSGAHLYLRKTKLTPKNQALSRTQVISDNGTSNASDSAATRSGKARASADSATARDATGADSATAATAATAAAADTATASSYAAPESTPSDTDAQPAPAAYAALPPDSQKKSSDDKSTADKSTADAKAAMEGEESKEESSMLSFGAVRQDGSSVEEESEKSAKDKKRDSGIPQGIPVLERPVSYYEAARHQAAAEDAARAAKQEELTIPGSGADTLHALDSNDPELDTPLELYEDYSKANGEAEHHLDSDGMPDEPGSPDPSAAVSEILKRQQERVKAREEQMRAVEKKADEAARAARERLEKHMKKVKERQQQSQSLSEGNATGDQPPAPPSGFDIKDRHPEPEAAASWADHTDER